MQNFLGWTPITYNLQLLLKTMVQTVNIHHATYVSSTFVSKKAMNDKKLNISRQGPNIETDGMITRRKSQCVNILIKTTLSHII